MMSVSCVSAAIAAAIDADLMFIGAFSIDQLMELAGLSVSQAVFREYPVKTHTNVLVCCGPGNNGGDGLVAARHLWQYGYKPVVYYPKPTPKDLYQRLCQQLRDLNVPVYTKHEDSDFRHLLTSSSLVVDALFGFSFKGPLRAPFDSILEAIIGSKLPVLSVDAPSSWDIDKGPDHEGPCKGFMPSVLISLTAPKPCSLFFRNKHYLGGRFVSKALLNKYHLVLPPYPGMDQIVDITGSKLETEESA
ncbi:YjeF family protein [Schizosaccharomyces japonicus yFS275]|uniref:NAD(P)H-hydrate epimerase n=1 Tax=Schizosaccharomyces japonicus (strain yFS275 / FY16936) TaxID=402676 RepID=B6K2J1_SCHJY|nr:YjeF family protein [Schizosaccharomyces japonicus yFS275]EEB07372.2 YjeF family protein [Schizosaccharomyces japonicus yFS275]